VTAGKTAGCNSVTTSSYTFESSSRVDTLPEEKKSKRKTKEEKKKEGKRKKENKEVRNKEVA